MIRVFGVFVAVIALTLLAPAAAFAEQAGSFDIDFTTDLQPVDVANPETNFAFTGMLPAGFEQDSAWQSDVSITAEPVETAGRSGLRFTRTGNGAVQIRRDLPPLEAGRYRMEITGRNPEALPMIAGLRQGAKPYRWALRRTPALGEEWRSETYEFTFANPVEGVSFFFIVRGPAGSSVDISRISLTRLDKQRVLAELDERFPEGSPKNLFRTTSLDQGLPTGWTLFGRHFFGTQQQYFGTNTNLEIVEDADMPTGLGQTLEITSPDEFVPINTAPMMVVEPDQPHTLSFFHRGEGRWQVLVRYDGQKVVAATSDFSPSDSWQRKTLTFQPELFNERCYVTFVGEGNIRLDGLQLEPGAQASDFTRAERSEVSLTMTNSVVDRLSVLYGTDSPAQLRLGLTHT
ncbi:MAG: hypothetical protein AAF743_03805, partial [Planctomycetota bacterium]